MKKIFTSVAVMTACAFGAFAQKNIDLEINLLLPQNNTAYGNLVDGQDSIPFFFEITNNGTANVAANDTLTLTYVGSFVGQNTNTKYRITEELSNYTLASGAKDTLGFFLKQGDVIASSSSENILVKFPHNAHDTLRVFIYGVDVNGDLFADDGVDEVTGSISGNNITGAALTFGTPTALKDLFANKAEVLNVYPNPTNGNVNIKHALTTAAEASVKVTDIAGRVVYTQNFGKQAAGEQTFNMNLSHLANGVYAIELTAGSQKATSKFTIKK